MIRVMMRRVLEAQLDHLAKKVCFIDKAESFCRLEASKVSFTGQFSLFHFIIIISKTKESCRVINDSPFMKACRDS